MTRDRMPAAVRAAFDVELDRAGTAPTSAQRWTALERAHILSQPWAGPHVVAHLAMLRLAMREHDLRESIGQLVRVLVAGPGSAVGRYPEGNTGRASVPLTRPMPMPADLGALLGTSRLGGPVRHQA